MTDVTTRKPDLRASTKQMLQYLCTTPGIIAAAITTSLSLLHWIMKITRRAQQHLHRLHMPAFSANIRAQLLSFAHCNFRDYSSTRAFVRHLDVILIVFGSVELADLQKLTQVNRAWERMGRQVLFQRISLELRSHIRPAVPDDNTSDNSGKRVILEFLELLDSTHSVVSGSAALAVCVQGTQRSGDWMDVRDMDIFTPLGCVDTVVQHLKEKLGYSIRNYA
ncbi:hypothetical protein PENSPDRAFT_672649, partial [Peniophora sp. CONT]